MLIYKNGDLLKAEENIICHQVNEEGYMGGGLALQVATQYPNVEQEYKIFCESAKDKDNLIGQYQAVPIGEHKYIINCFSQREFNTDYKALKQIFTGLLETCKLTGMTIAVPFKYGCGIANGKWEDVENIFKVISKEYGVDISIYKLEDI
jgi:O-acetyl-ADP-ribose deacetylase (regulator of RNase III)